MANHKSAEKRARQALVRRARARKIKSEVRGRVKTLQGAIAAGLPEEAGAALRGVESGMRRAVSKGVIKRNTAWRNISRLARAVHALGEQKN